MSARPTRTRQWGARWTSLVLSGAAVCAPAEPTVPRSPFRGPRFSAAPTMVQLQGADWSPEPSPEDDEYAQRWSSARAAQSHPPSQTRCNQRPCWRTANEDIPWVLSPPYARRASVDETPCVDFALPGEEVEWQVRSMPCPCAIGGWAPLSQVLEGAAALARWNAHAASEAPFHCDGGSFCTIFVRVSGDRGRNGIARLETLQRCDVKAPANQPMGMPQNCESVAAWDGKQVWLRAWMFAREECSHGLGAFGSTSPDYRFTLEGPATLTIQRVLEAAAAAMKDPH